MKYCKVESKGAPFLLIQFQEASLDVTSEVQCAAAKAPPARMDLSGWRIIPKHRKTQGKAHFPTAQSVGDHTA